MGTKSLVSIGKQAFELLSRIHRSTNLAQLRLFLHYEGESKRVQFYNLIKNLEDAGWIEVNNNKGKITNSGKWFLKMFYENEKLKERFK